VGKKRLELEVYDECQTNHFCAFFFNFVGQLLQNGFRLLLRQLPGLTDDVAESLVDLKSKVLHIKLFYLVYMKCNARYIFLKE
jgi:hypothetical protein